jgi:S-adenosylmethionine-diacylglycerol 3-amino-3-carboxypropyl transferase
MTAAPAVREARFFRGIGYSSVWEDEAIVTRGLRPRPGDRVLSVTSGGCFTLQLLLAGAEEVVSVDWSPHQTALLALKAAALAALPPGEVWQALGLRPAPDRGAIYRRLREALPADARSYWDARPGIVRAGAALCGRQDRYLHGVGRAVRLLQGRSRVRRLLACEDAADQRRFYDEEWNGVSWRALCGIVFSRFVLDRAFDPAHFTYAREGAPGPRFRAAVEGFLREVPAAPNFYLHYLFTRTYPSDACCPAWLRRGAPEALAARLDRLRALTGTIEEVLAAAPARSFDVFNLSNVLDWCSEEEFERVLREIVRTARPGARLCTWTNIVNRRRAIPRERFPQVEVEDGLAREIEAGCRTPGYSGCLVATVG